MWTGGCHSGSHQLVLGKDQHRRLHMRVTWYMRCACAGGELVSVTQQGVSARVWLRCKACVYPYLVGAVCLRPRCVGCVLLSAVPVAAWASEEARSLLSPKGCPEERVTPVCVCMCWHACVSWPWAPVKAALSPKLTPLACLFVLLSVCAGLARCPFL